MAANCDSAMAAKAALTRGFRQDATYAIDWNPRLLAVILDRPVVTVVVRTTTPFPHPPYERLFENQVPHITSFAHIVSFGKFRPSECNRKMALHGMCPPKNPGLSWGAVGCLVSRPYSKSLDPCSTGAVPGVSPRTLHRICLI